MSKRVKQTSYHNCNNSYCLLVLSYIKRVCHKKQSTWLNSQTLSFFVKHIHSICRFYTYHFWFWSKLFLVGYTYSELKVLCFLAKKMKIFGPGCTHPHLRILIIFWKSYSIHWVAFWTSRWYVHRVIGGRSAYTLHSKQKHNTAVFSTEPPIHQ